MLDPPVGDIRRLTLVTQPAKYGLPVLDGAVLVADATHQGLEGVGVAQAANGGDMLAVMVGVAMSGRSSSDVGAEDAVVILALAEVQSARVFKGGS